LHRQSKIQLPYDHDHDGPVFIEGTGIFMLYMIYLLRRQLWDFSNYRMNLRYTLKLSFENKGLNILGLRFRIEITVCCVIDTLEFVMRWDLPPFLYLCNTLISRISNRTYFIQLVSANYLYNI